MKRMVLGVLVLGGLAAGIGAFCRFEYGNPAKTCTLCHEIRDSKVRWEKSPHHGTDCKACHGGTLESIGDNVKRGLVHFRGADYGKFGTVFCLSEKQVEDMCARCAKCHQSEYEQWRKSGHGKMANVFLQDKEHNAAWKPADHCLRCHGMFLEGDIEKQMARTDLGQRHAVPCMACHRIHSEESLQLYSRNDQTSFPAKDLSIQKIVTKDGGREVRRASDARTRLCVNCHAANAEGIAGSSDDRTPLGAQEGMACTDCHHGHGRKADATRGRCPAASPNVQTNACVTSPICGPYPLLVTPWTEDAKLDIDVLVKEADYVESCQAGGIIWPTADEVLRNLSAAEYEAGLRALAKRAAERGFNARITAICPGTDSAAACARVRLVQRIADETQAKMAILARPPDNATNQTLIAQHYRALAQVTQLPVIIQTYTGTKNAPQPDVDLLVQLAREFPHIYGFVKEESPGLKVNGRMAELLSHEEIKTVLSGWGGKGWMFQGTKIGTRGIISQRPAYAGLFRRIADLVAEGRDASDPELASTYAKYLYMCNLGDTFTETDDNFRGPHLYVLQKLGIFRNRLTRNTKGVVTDYTMTELEKREVEQRMRYCGLLK